MGNFLVDILLTPSPSFSLVQCCTRPAPATKGRRSRSRSRSRSPATVRHHPSSYDGRGSIPHYTPPSPSPPWLPSLASASHTRHRRSRSASRSRSRDGRRRQRRRQRQRSPSFPVSFPYRGRLPPPSPKSRKNAYGRDCRRDEGSSRHHFPQQREGRYDYRPQHQQQQQQQRGHFPAPPPLMPMAMMAAMAAMLLPQQMQIQQAGAMGGRPMMRGQARSLAGHGGNGSNSGSHGSGGHGSGDGGGGRFGRGPGRHHARHGHHGHPYIARRRWVEEKEVEERRTRGG